MDYSAALNLTMTLHARLAKRRPNIDILERYYRGEHPLKYATQEWQAAHAERYQDFSDNWCGVVGSAPGERTELYGFRLGEDGENLSSDERDLMYAWEVNEGPAQSSQGFLMSTIAKRSAVIVWGDEDDEPVMTWERPDQVIVDYAPENPRKRRSALKTWVEDGVEFATLYTPDEVWKWKRDTTPTMTESGLHIASTGPVVGTWIPRDAEGEPWPLANPMGRVPVVEFPNRPTLGGEPLSDIEGTMAMQNAINLLWAYLFNAADYASMPTRVVMGHAPPKIPILDENGQKIGEKAVDSKALTMARMQWLTGENVKIGQWDPAKLDVFTDTIQVAIKHVAAQTRTPIYLIHGELGNVNGETLTGLDAPLNAKVREAHKFYRSPMREVFSLFALVKGNKPLADQCRVGDVQWKNPEVRSDAQVSDAAVKDKQVGWPFEAILERRYGLSQQQIARILEQRTAEVELMNSDPYLNRLAVKDAADPAVDGGEVRGDTEA